MKFIHLTDLHLVTPGDQLKGLDPVARLRYSATHKRLWNLIYRLSPFEAYKDN